MLSNQLYTINTIPETPGIIIGQLAYFWVVGRYCQLTGDCSFSSGHRPERLCGLYMLAGISLLFCGIDSMWQHYEICPSIFWNTLDFEAPTVLLYDFT